MHEVRSPFYPPRAKWYSRAFCALDSLRHLLFLEHLRPSIRIKVSRLLLALAVPGVAFFFINRPRTGRVVLWSYGALFLLFLVGYGSTWATLAFGLMLALHAMSWASLLELWVESKSWKQRLVNALLALLLVSTFIYMPAQRLMQNRLVIPLRIHNATILVIPSNPYHLRPGATAIFRIEAGGASGLRIREGYVISEILAQPGDRILFDKGTYRVNGASHSALPQMPAEGEWVVPENHWFIWPFSSIGIHGDLRAVPPGTANMVVHDLAMVAQSNMVGRPMRWWFWRKLYVP